MGRSSSQVVGYRHYAKFAAFIGNRIEKLIAVNFDNRKWVVHDPLKHPPNLLPVLEGNLFGENEGGVSGNIDIHFGTPDQEPNEVYQQYLPLVSGYPYQSYLLFRGITSVNQFTGAQTTAPGFYLGNSGYMKEMLLWVKRIHVKNDGNVQWYDEKAEIGAISLYYGSSKLHNFTIPLSGRVFYQMERSPGSPEEPPIESKSYASGVLPIYDAEQSYQNDPEAPTSTPIPVPPSLVAVQNFFINNYLPTDEYDGIELPPTIFDLAPIQGDRGTQIARYYQFTGDFYWLGGVFSGQALMSGNAASISLLRKNEVGDWVILHMLLSASSGINYDLFDFSQHLESGFYRVLISTGFHYLLQNTPRPFIGLWVYAELQAALNNGDINPIHKIREIITDDTAMNKPQSDVNDDNFKKAADRIFEEGLGISWAIDEKSCIEAIDELCYHIEAGIRVNRQTGLYEMVLFRDDWFNEDEIHDIAENKIKDLSLEVMNSDDIVNQLNVTYYDRERIKNSTFSIYENGSILTMCHANAESVEFPYFMNMRNAEIVANWKLKQFSTPSWSGSLTTGWREARKWNRYDLIRLPWSKKWNGTILVRIMKINLGNGTDNTVTIDFEEVIPYSGEMNTSIVVDAPIESAPQPPQPSMNAVFEAPYYLIVLRAGQTNADLELSNNPEIGYVAAIAAKPQNNSLNALIYTDGGVGEFEQVSRLDYCDILQLDEPIIETASSFVVTGSLTQTANSNNLILLNGELMGFVSFDAETKVLTVKRGALDTIPKKHNSGDLFVFDLPDIAFDSTQYAQGEIVEAQVLTTTPSGVQGLSAAGVPVEIQARAIRPYPPANVKINGEYYPEDEISSDMTVTWVDRNRLQQTGGSLIGWYDGGVTVETDVEYTYKLYDADSDALLDSATGITSPLAIPKTSMALNNRLELYSEKNGYRSFQSFVYNFVKSASDPWLPQLLSPTVWIDANTQAVNGSGYFNSATDLSGNGYDLSATGGTIGHDAVRDFKYFRATSNGYLSTSAAAAFNGKSRAWMFAILNCASSVERYIFDIGARRFEIGAFSSAYAGYNLNTHQQESSGYWSAASSLTRPLNTWHMLLVEVDLNSGFKIYRNGTIELSVTRTPSRVIFSNQIGLGLQTLTAANAEDVKCAVMLSGYSDISFDRAKIFGWAAHEYGLTDLLPVDHPYKTKPPMV